MFLLEMLPETLRARDLVAKETSIRYPAGVLETLGHIVFGHEDALREELSNMCYRAFLFGL